MEETFANSEGGRFGERRALRNAFDGEGVAVIGEGHLRHAQFKVMHSLKWLIRAILVIVVIRLIIEGISLPAKVGKEYSNLLTAKWEPFQQKEGLQWLGASADVVRGDYENNQDSLAEKAMKADQRVTDISAPLPVKKATFVPYRERMSTPEEEQMKKITA